MANYDEANPLVRILPCKGDRGVNTGATVVTSASDMTDTTKAYLYAGTTGGDYTKGHWYYWDGTEWKDGGDYTLAVLETEVDPESANAVESQAIAAALDALEAHIPAIDDTLTVQGAGADAKATGEKFNAALHKLPNIEATGQDADSLADDNGWRIITATVAHFPFAVGLLISVTPSGQSNIRYQLAYPYNLAGGDKPKMRLRKPNTEWTDWYDYYNVDLSKTLQQLNTITATGQDADLLANEAGWHIIADTANVAHFPFSAGLLLSYVSTGSNIRFQCAYPYDLPSGDKPQIRRRKPNGEWSDWTNYNASDASDATMLVEGNSILVGSVWTVQYNSSTDKWTPSVSHFPSSWGNAPYSVVAKRLGVDKSKTNRNGAEVMLHSSTGLMYVPNAPSTGEPESKGSFLNIIRGDDVTIGGTTYHLDSIDLSNYDYVLTHFWTGDMTAGTTDNPISGIGSVNSTADDGTLAGGVLALLDYINESNPACRLILVSVPPVNTNADRNGNNTFTGVYPNGSTIAELDTLMHTLAERHHFVYIDWQGMNLSYHYQDFTGGKITAAMIAEHDTGQTVGTKLDNVHANNEDTYRRMGQYLAEHI